MSVTPMLLACPSCGAESPADVRQSINVQNEPGARDDLLDGRVNTFTCPKCGAAAVIPASLLYHDPERGIMAQYYPLHSLKETDFYSQFDAEGRIRISLPGDQEKNMPEYLNNIHIVFSMTELARYVRFREDLFDYRHKKEHPPTEISPEA